MKFCYCPKCNEIRPKNWHSGTTCYKCQDECIVYKVPRTALGYLMYVCDVIAAGLLILYVAYYNANIKEASFISSISQNVYIVLLFAFIVLSFIFGYVDLRHTTERAYKMIPVQRQA